MLFTSTSIATIRSSCSQAAPLVASLDYLVISLMCLWALLLANLRCSSAVVAQANLPNLWPLAVAAREQGQCFSSISSGGQALCALCRIPILQASAQAWYVAPFPTLHSPNNFTPCTRAHSVIYAYFRGITVVAAACCPHAWCSTLSETHAADQRQQDPPSDIPDGMIVECFIFSCAPEGS